MVAPPPPGTNDTPPAAPPPGDDATPPAIAAPTLRELVAKVLKSDSDLDAFCIDYFKDVHDRFTNGMDRVAKVNQLLSHADHGEIRRRLPAAEIRIARRRRLKGGALALVALGVAAAGGIMADRLRERPPVVTPDTLIPSFDPFPAQAPGVVLGGPWMKEHGHDLYKALFDLDPQHAVRSVPFTRFASVTAFHEKARAAGAVVIVDVGEDGIAHVELSGPLAKNALLLEPLNIVLPLEATPARAAGVINALVSRGGRRSDLAPGGTCPDLGAEQLDRLALLTLLVVPKCASQEVGALRFRGMCPPPPQPMDATCALAIYLEAQHNPGVAREKLGLLQRGSLPGFQTLAKVKLAYLDCVDGRTEDAARAILDISSAQLRLASPDPCTLAQLAETAACIVTQPDNDHVLVKSGLLDEIKALEGSQIDPNKACLDVQRAESMARRGYWRGLGGRWDGARADYEDAYELSADRARGLDFAEASLWMKDPEQAKKTLGLLDHLDTPVTLDQETTAALLRWLTARQAGDASEERAAESSLGALQGRAGTAPALTGLKGESLRRLTCGAAHVTNPGCVYNVLRRPSSNEELKASFRAHYDGGVQGKSR